MEAARQSQATPEADSARQPAPDVAPATARSSSSPLPTALLALQRAAGNRATTALLAQRQGPTPAPTAPFSDALPPSVVEERPKPVPLGSGPYAHRLGEAWDYGPISNRKSAAVDMPTFVGWVKEVEGAYGPNQKVVFQRLRKLYYSSASGKAGGGFDQLIDDVEGAGGLPMTIKKVTPATLDGLYSVDTVSTPAGAVIDPAHIIAALDVSAAGQGIKSTIATDWVYDIPAVGIVTWVGDLASWWIGWLERLRDMKVIPTKRPVTKEGRIDTSFKGTGPAFDESLWLDVGKSKASKEDLLGDMDAQVIAKKAGKESMKRFKSGNFDRKTATGIIPKLSELLEEHYGLAAAGGSSSGGSSNESNRFADFVMNASPKIPHRKVKGATGPNGAVELGGRAEWDISNAISSAGMLFFKEKTSFGDDVLDAYAYRLFQQIPKRFVTFLETGLKNGDAPWP